MRYAQTLSFSLLAIATSAPTQAESTDIFGLSLEQLLDTPILSTSFVTESFINTNYNVTPKNSQYWDSGGIRYLGELINHMPSTVAPLSFAQSRTIAIRGYLDAGADTGTAMRIDDVPLTKLRQGGSLMALDGYDLNLLQSVELIRGPGSSLHGNDAFHGVLSLNTLSYDDNQTNVSIEAGGFDHQSLSFNNQIISDKHRITTGLTYRKIGDVGQAYTYTDNATREDAVATRKNARESSNALIKYQYQQSDWTINSTVFLLSFDADEQPGPGFTSVGNLQDKDVSDYRDNMQLFRIGGRYQFDSHRSVELLAFHWQDQDELIADARTLPVYGFKLSEVREESHSGIHIRQQYLFSNDSHLTYGYEYLSARQDKSDMHRTYLDNTTEYLEQPGVGYHRKLHSLFVDGNQQLNNNGLQLKYGLRFDSYNDFDEQLTPRLGLSQPISNKHIIHLTYGEGFRAPALFEMLGNQHTAPNIDLQPETLQSLDLKYTVEMTHIFNTLTFYKNQWKNGIERMNFDEPKNDYVSQYSNIGKSSAYGFEYEVKGRWDKLQIDFSFSYNKNKNEEKNDEANEDYLTFPRWISGFNAGYKLNPQWDIFCNNRYIYRSDYSINDTHSPAINYLRTDAILAWQNNRGLQMYFTIRNLFNKNLYIPTATLQPNGLADEERNFSTQIKYSF